MEKNKSGERKQIKEESKKKVDCRSSLERIEAEKQKVVVQQHKKLKADNIRRKQEENRKWKHRAAKGSKSR